jgi:hypothetical protein
LIIYVKQVDDIESKLDGLIEMYKDDRQGRRQSVTTMVRSPSSVSRDDGGNESACIRTTKTHLTMIGASRVSHSSSPPLPPPAPVFNRQVDRMEDVVNSEPIIPVQMDDKGCDSYEEMSISPSPRRLSSRFRQPLLTRNASDLGPRMLGHQMAMIEQCCRTTDIDQALSDDHPLKPVNTASSKDDTDDSTQLYDVSGSCDCATDCPSLVSVSVSLRIDNDTISS